MTEPQDFTKINFQTNDKIVSKEALPKQVVGGRYEIISILGRGGMGLVYRVRQIFLNKEFALKMLEKNNITATAVRRFQQEAKTTFSLKHPAIIAVNDFGVLDDQTPFLVMELVHGETLAERLKRLGPMEVAELIRTFVPVCFGLAHAHKMGIVHRDIKPSNIMLINGVPLGAEGSVKIVDFGIAKFTMGEQNEAQALTRTGEIFGSPYYMSPEQCSGARVDHRSDVYSLGCVMFEALTGAPPLMGENALSTMMKHQSERPLTLKAASLGGNFPEGLEELVATLLAKSPDDRYEDMVHVAHDLKALERGEAVSVSTSTSAVQPPKFRSALSPYLWIVGIAIASLALLEVCTYHPQVTQDRPLTKDTFLAEDRELEHAKDEISAVSEISKETDSKWLKGKLARKNNHYLSLQGRKLTDASIELIAKTDGIRDLSLDACSFEDNRSFSRIAQMRLSSIKLNETNIDDDGATRLSESKTLYVIDVAATQLSDAGIRNLTHTKELQWLDLSKTKTTAKGLTDLSHAKKLKFLVLNGAKNINDDELLQLTLPKLTRLSLEDTEVSFAGIKSLCEKNKSIGKIALWQCKKLQAADIDRLRQLFPKTEFIVTKS